MNRDQIHRCRVCGGIARKLFRPWPAPDLCPACAAVTGKGPVQAIPVDNDELIPFVDVADFDEDHRIGLIASQVAKGNVVAFITDDEPGKAERYIQKLTQRVPGLIVKDRLPGPAANTVTVKIAQDPEKRGQLNELPPLSN